MRSSRPKREEKHSVASYTVLYKHCISLLYDVYIYIYIYMYMYIYIYTIIYICHHISINETNPTPQSYQISPRIGPDRQHTSRALAGYLWLVGILRNTRIACRWSLYSTNSGISIWRETTIYQKYPRCCHTWRSTTAMIATMAMMHLRCLQMLSIQGFQRHDVSNSQMPRRQHKRM